MRQRSLRNPMLLVIVALASAVSLYISSSGVDAAGTADIVVTISMPSPITAPDFHYTITVTNNGPNNGLKPITVVGLADPHLAFIKAIAVLGSDVCTNSESTFACTLQPLFNGNFAVIDIRALVAVDTPNGTIISASAIESSPEDFSRGNDSATASSVLQLADLIVTKTHTGNFPPSSIGQYTLVVSNIGPSPSTGNVDLFDQLPAGLSPISFSGTGWSCTLTPSLECQRADTLNAGAAYPPLTLRVLVAASAPASVTNTASLFYPSGSQVYIANDTAHDFTVIGATTQAGTLVVHKDFSDSSTSTVSIGVSCSGGATPATTPVNASDNPDSPAVFTINNIPAGGTICTATEASVPSGYTANQTGCAAVSLSQGGTQACTIGNAANLPATSATFVVHKDFSDSTASPVSIGVSCTGGATAAVTPLNARDNPDLPAAFTINNVPASGATCGATEATVPAGYTGNQTSCAAVILSQGGVVSCTIVNTVSPPAPPPPPPATLTVHKDFTDLNPAPVSISVSCTNGATPAATPLNARDNPDAPAVFTITNVPAGGTNCTATEPFLPQGYTAVQAGCTAVALAPGASGSCTITNQPATKGG